MIYIKGINISILDLLASASFWRVNVNNSIKRYLYLFGKLQVLKSSILGMHFRPDKNVCNLSKQILQALSEM